MLRVHDCLDKSRRISYLTPARASRHDYKYVLGLAAGHYGRVVAGSLALSGYIGYETVLGTTCANTLTHTLSVKTVKDDTAALITQYLAVL